MDMGIGIDIVKISRINNPDTFKNAILSNKEIVLYDKAIKKEEFLAGRFAAKEAFMKATELGMKIPFKEIEILYRVSGSPYIAYKDKEYELSIAHDGDYAVAIAKYE
ncbi:MAG TPA: holo-[acyl-carrier-protein] synthase [Firmicutes bacterium]|nr:holo-[acyl-carrier-protein] synthase [Bacillota bacterium]